MLELGVEDGGSTVDLGRTPPDLAGDIFMGHEFSGEVVELGPDTDRSAIGTIVTSVPVMVTPTGIQDLAYTNLFPCGYSERMLLSSLLVLRGPQRPRPTTRRAHRADGRRPARRQPLGDQAGRRRPRRSAADRWASPSSPPSACAGSSPSSPATSRPPAVRWRRRWAPTRSSTRPRSRRSRPGPAVGGGRPLVVFEAIGVPGIIDELLRLAPTQSRIVDRRCLHAARRDHALLRHRQGAQPAVRARLRPARVRGQPAGDRRRAHRRHADDHGRGRHRRHTRCLRSLAHPDEHCKILVVPNP